MEVRIKELRFKDTKNFIGITMSSRIIAEKDKCEIIFDSDLQHHVLTFDADKSVSFLVPVTDAIAVVNRIQKVDNKQKNG
jgi:hypothetical protein